MVWTNVRVGRVPYLSALCKADSGAGRASARNATFASSIQVIKKGNATFSNTETKLNGKNSQNMFNIYIYMLSSAGSHPFPSVPSFPSTREKRDTPAPCRWHLFVLTSTVSDNFRWETWRRMRVSSFIWTWWGKQIIIHWFLIIFTSNGNVRRLYAPDFWTDPPWLPFGSWICWRENYF